MQEELKFKEYPLHDQIKHALSELGFVRPLQVQQAAIPYILEGRDLIVQSQTGSGKTAAFGIPICDRIDPNLATPQAVILVPTRELALQVQQDISEIGKYRGIQCIALFGKQPIELQRKLLKQGPHIIVATPGRLVDHLSKRNTKLNNVAYFVLDEADEMLLMGFKDQIDAVVKKLPATELRCNLLFSATMPYEVVFLGQEYMRSPETLTIEAQVSNTDKIEQIYYAVDGLKKVDFLKKMLRYERIKKAVIFCNTQNQVSSLYDILKKWDHTFCAVHGGMDQGDRQEAIKGFKSGVNRFLIATDVAGRGLHVDGVTHVINYSVPFEHEQYIHRVGRTGRVDEEGVAISLVIPSELDRFNDLQKYLGYTIPCKGGHHSQLEQIGQLKTKKKLRDPNETSSGKQRYKDPLNGKTKSQKDVQRSGTLQIIAGMGNSRLKTSDILAALRSIPGIVNSDIGRVEMRDQITNVIILNDKLSLVLKTMRTKKINGKVYKVCRG